MITQLIYSW